ncbi:MAG: hypothetical protein GY811_07355 [Myxococcales bacterium]|nr:hypothetical protein [Myxococcales bacterium]
MRHGAAVAVAWCCGDLVKHEPWRRALESLLSPDPGGRWNWLLGLISLGVASVLLILLTRNAVARVPPLKVVHPEFDEELHWQERLEDELIDSDT